MELAWRDLDTELQALGMNGVYFIRIEQGWCRLYYYRDAGGEGSAIVGDFKHLDEAKEAANKMEYRR